MADLDIAEDFCAGADLKGRADVIKGPGDLPAHSRRTRECFHAIRECAKPVVAAINGIAMGGGLFVGTAGGRLLAIDVPTGIIGWDATVANPKGATELERIADDLTSGRQSLTGVPTGVGVLDKLIGKTPDASAVSSALKTALGR